MKKVINISRNKKIIVCYIINYLAALFCVFSAVFLHSITTGFLCFFMVFSLLVLDTYFIKKWYHFFACTISHSISNLAITAIYYIMYNSESYGILNIDSVSLILEFVIINLLFIITVTWSSAGLVFKYKIYANKNNSKSTVFNIIIWGFILMTVIYFILSISDFLFSQMAFFQFIPLITGLLLNMFLIFVPYGNHVN